MNDWKTLLLGTDNSWLFLVECALRAMIMFLVVLFKITGKREVRQLSVFEIIVVIGLGSVLGDPMIYTDSPTLPAVAAMLVVLLCYWAMNKGTSRVRGMEKLIEGDVVPVFKYGVVDTEALKKQGMTAHEFYGELRVQHVEQLGQVKSAYVEIEGEVSVFFLPAKEVGHGLPMAPEFLRSKVRIVSSGPVACCGCGAVRKSAEGAGHCVQCATDQWVAASNAKRLD